MTRNKNEKKKGGNLTGMSQKSHQKQQQNCARD